MAIPAKSILVMLMIAAGSASHAGTSYDPNVQFDINNNPSATGGWSYGSTDGLGGVFALLPTKLTTNPAFAGWTVSAQVSYPDIPKNISGAVYTDPNGGYFPKDAISLAPGQGSTTGFYAVIRWTTPVVGQYAINSAFNGVWDHADSTGDVHILVNGVSIFDGSIDRQSSTTYSGVSSLIAGDVVDFAAGQHGTNVWVNSILSATITAVPEPSEYALLLIGGCAIYLRKKCRKGRSVSDA